MAAVDPIHGVCRTLAVTQHCPAPMRKREVWRIDQFHLLRKIGSGYASTVYYGTCRATSNQVAIKLYHKTKLSELNLFQVSREVKIHAELDHKHIIQLWAAFEDQYGIYLLFEFASKGDVFTEVERRGGQLSEAESVRQVIYPFLAALDYLHSRNIIHRDIKPENLLFTATNTLKVGDFGLSIDCNQERPVTRVGTLDYMAPEVVTCPDKHRPHENKELKHLYYTHLVDAWAIGVLAYELIMGKPPFDKGNKKATVQEILTGEPFLPASVSDSAAHFVRWALTKDQRQRPSVQQLAGHPWVVGHMKGPVLAARRLIHKTDSFVEPRQLGFRDSIMSAGPETASAPRDIAPPRPLQVASLANGGRFLGHSNSMTAMDGMRFRDIHIDSLTGETNTGMAATAHEALSAVKRLSDGDGTTGGRPSAAGGRVSRAGFDSPMRTSNTGSVVSDRRISRTGNLSRRESGTGGGMSLSRMGSVGLMQLANTSQNGAMSGAEESPKAGQRMTREEMLAALQVPMPIRLGSASGASLNRSLSSLNAMSVIRPPSGSGLHSTSVSGMRTSGNGSVSSVTAGSPRMLQRASSFAPAAGGPAAGGSPGRAGAVVPNLQQARPSSLAVSSSIIDYSPRHGQGSVMVVSGTTSEPGIECQPRLSRMGAEGAAAAAGTSASTPASPRAGGALRPVAPGPPQVQAGGPISPSSSASGGGSALSAGRAVPLKPPGSPLVPSRLSHSFTSATSPLASASGSTPQAPVPSRLGKSNNGLPTHPELSPTTTEGGGSFATAPSSRQPSAAVTPVGTPVGAAAAGHARLSANSPLPSPQAQPPPQQQHQQRCSPSRGGTGSAGGASGDYAAPHGDESEGLESADGLRDSSSSSKSLLRSAKDLLGSFKKVFT